jgi:hypothetical protein
MSTDTCMPTYQVFLLPEKKEETLDHTLTRGYTREREDLYRRNKRNGKQTRSLVKKVCVFFL